MHPFDGVVDHKIRETRCIPRGHLEHAYKGQCRPMSIYKHGHTPYRVNGSWESTTSITILSTARNEEGDVRASYSVGS